MSNLLNKHRVEVRAQGPLVLLMIGNTEIKMEYDAAIKISTWMRVKGKEAKRNAGDHSRSWTVIGDLRAVEAGERPRF